MRPGDVVELRGMYQSRSRWSFPTIVVVIAAEPWPTGWEGWRP